MSGEPTREEIDKLLNRANELLGTTPVKWHELHELMDKLRAIVREAEQREAGGE